MVFLFLIALFYGGGFSLGWFMSWCTYLEGSNKN
jgi:hypothetical protein